jgi:predicted transcriptional regulator of viral defense system
MNKIFAKSSDIHYLSQKYYFMVMEEKYMNLEQWTDIMLSKGRHGFSLAELKKVYPEHSDVAIKYSLLRLSKKKKILSIVKGYYIIISPQYLSRGILPPDLFIDSLMKYLNRPYYIGLLNAATYYGAAHQQPQEFFVFTRFPVMRPIQKKGIKINYISKKSIDDSLLEQKKTETGYLKVSKPILTAFDLVQFENRIGGLSRASTVLSELVEEIKPESINSQIISQMQVSSIQRLGFIIEYVLQNESLAKALYNDADRNKFYRIPLKSALPVKGYPYNEKWKIVINTEIETDL